MKRNLGLCWLGLLLIAASGFSQVPRSMPPMPPESEGVWIDPLSLNPYELMTRAAALLQKGDTNAALGLLTTCDEISLRQHANGFSALLNILMTTGNLSEAERIYLENQEQYDRLTADYFTRLYQHVLSQGDKQALLEWTTSLQAKALPPGFRAQAFGWLLEASRGVGPVSRVTELVPVCMSQFDAPTSCGLLTGIVSAYDAAGDTASANQVVDAIERAAGRKPEWRMVVTCQRVKLLFSSAQWKKAEARFRKEAPAIPDGELAGCFQHALARASRTNQLDLTDRLCDWILKEQKAKSETWSAAAGVWLETAKARNAMADIPVRFTALMQMGYPNTTIVSCFDKYCYWVLKDGKPADILAMIQFARKLAPTVADKRDRESIDLMIAEGYFIMGDYETTLKLFEQPLPALEGGQQEILKDKIKAHWALQKGNKQEAIDRFRAFMETVKTWTHVMWDPLTGMMFDKEMVLGLNAKRIGDILSSMNDAKGAQAAYQEAVRYYALAEKEMKARAQESEHIKARQTELTQLLKK